MMMAAALTPEDKRAEAREIMAKVRADRAAGFPALGAYTPHPVLGDVPWMTNEEFVGLVWSIKRTGLLDPIVVDGDVIIDGRCRLVACGLAGVEPRFKSFQYDGEPDRLMHSIAYMTPGDEIFAASLLYWRPSAFTLLTPLCKPGTEAEQQIWEALGRAKDARDIDDALSAEPDYEPDYEPEFEPDFEPDTDDAEAPAFEYQSHWLVLTP
jgi:hypothetical protein